MKRAILIIALMALVGCPGPSLIRVLPDAYQRWLDRSASVTNPGGPNGVVLSGSGQPIPTLALNYSYALEQNFTVPGQKQIPGSIQVGNAIEDNIGPGGPWNFVVDYYFVIETDLPAAHFHFEAAVVHGRIDNMQARVLNLTGQIGPVFDPDLFEPLQDLYPTLPSPPGLGFSPIGNLILDADTSLPAGQYNLQIKGDVISQRHRLPAGAAYEGFMSIRTVP
jgi:hypothetical protein